MSSLAAPLRVQEDGIGGKLSSNGSGRHTQLDVLRAVCVLAVAWVHICPEAAAQNPMLSLNWTMQYLSLTSGVLFAMTSAPLLSYCLRLGSILACGVLINAIPIVTRFVRGSKIYHVGQTLMMQYWYVIALMCAAVTLTPLKIALAHAEKTGKISVASIGYLLCALLSICLLARESQRVTYMLPQSWMAEDIGMHELPLYVSHTCGYFLFAALGLCIRARWIGWILLLYTHLLMLTEVHRIGQYMMFFQLMATGFVLYHAPLCACEKLQPLVWSLWPLIVFVLYCGQNYVGPISPDTFPRAALDRVRMAAANFVCCAIFGICWCPNLYEHDPKMRSWRMGETMAWLAPWSLAVYMGHCAFWNMLRLHWRPREAVVLHNLQLCAIACIVLSGVCCGLWSSRTQCAEPEENCDPDSAEWRVSSRRFDWTASPMTPAVVSCSISGNSGGESYGTCEKSADPVADS